MKPDELLRVRCPKCGFPVARTQRGTWAQHTRSARGVGYGSSRRERCPQSFEAMPAELVLASLEQQAEDLQRRVDAREATRTKLRTQLAELDARDDKDHATMEWLDAAIECHKRECQPRQGG